MTDLEKLERLLRHIENVRENCTLLGRKLIEKGESSLGLRLIANGHVHDNSKFFGNEWDFICDGSPKKGLKSTVIHHHKTNAHHPEYWNGVAEMPEVFLAEMVCDWKARASEMGNSIHEWINTVATKKYNFTRKSEVYSRIMKYVDMICDKPFQPIEEEKELTDSK